MSTDSISNTLFGIFFILSAFNMFHMVYIASQGLFILNKWYKKIDELNIDPDSISDDELDEFEESAESESFISSLIDKVKKIAVNSHDLSVNEIHEIIDDDVMKWEQGVNASANRFIMLGVLFTVLGLFSGLPDRTVDTEVIKNLLGNFKVAFITTILGIIFSAISKAVQSFIAGKRDLFRYSIVLMIKSHIVPRYAIKDADEKNLGKMLRSITKSSNELQRAADAVSQMAESAKIGTENVENAVSGFAVITEKMSQREDALITNLGNLGKHLVNVQTSLDDTFPTLTDSIRQDISDHAAASAAYIQSIEDLKNEQTDINKKMGKALKNISDSQKKMGAFFGKDFIEIFKVSLKDLTDQYVGHIDEILNGINTMRSRLDDNTITKDDFESQISDLMKLYNDKVSGIYDEVISIKPGLEELKTTLNGIESLNEDKQSAVNDLKKLTNDISEKLSSVHDNVYSVMSNMDTAKENTVLLDIDQMTPIRDDLSLLRLDLNSVKVQIDALMKSVDNISKMGVSGTSIFDGIRNIFPGSGEDKK